MTTPLLRLAHHVLASPSTRFVPDLRLGEVERAVMTSQVGVDPFVGERMLATHCDGSASNEGPFAGFALTSHRLIVGAYAVRLDHVIGARQTGPVTFEVLTPRGPLGLACTAAASLVAFLHQLIPVHPGARGEPVRPLLSNGPGDELGLIAEINTPGVDRRALSLFALLSSGADQTRAIPRDGALDLARRSVLVARKLRDGRGMVDGWWVSPLTVADFQGALSRVLGPPVQGHNEDAMGTHRVVLRAHGPMIVGGTEGLDLDVPPGIASLPPTAIELRVADLRGFATFQMRVLTDDPLALVDVPSFIHGTLGELEVRLLALRMLFAWSMPADRLLDAPRDAIRERHVALAPMADLSTLLPKGERSQAMTNLVARAHEAAQAELQKSPAQRQDEARARFAAALAGSDRDAMWDAALRLQHAQAYDDGEKAYAELGRRFPEQIAEAASSRGDCVLFSVLYCGKPVAEAHAPILERAVALYLEALGHGRRAEQLDENLWEATRALSRVHPDRARRIWAVDLYRTTCPQGRNLPDADARMRELSS